VWTEYRNNITYADVAQYASGAYQTAILQGHHSLSGSTLKGKARSWLRSYFSSRRALLTRLTDAQVPWHIETGANNKKILVIGE
jgi:hypothetical protein